ncbi:MAG TPA: ACP synthase [Aminobacterium sp.]|jgi:holo-[acyl-carrier protein] synthase|uniref:holo-ACP synthase n=1 Tax=Aminobacterium TaxID=81466 RepID=UPI000ECF42AD|nr:MULTISPECIES: holo-ACP synthase [unclassified Aminobacterium]HCA40220.1 ACP synthase [Aminobacterium sp.]
MIQGIGVDLCRISRIGELVKNRRFLQRVFHEEEQDYAFKKPVPARHLAASFAAREAFVKASGLDFFQIVFRGVWIRRFSTGPSIVFSPQIEQWMNKHCLLAHVSLSHDGDFALAFVVLEKR